MRKNIVAGNWKMNTTLPEGLALAKGLDEALKGKTPNCDVIIGTPFTHLASVAAAIDTNKIGVAAENCADKEKGAYTGEVSAAMVASTGAKYVILGHSERRAYYHETPEILKTKVELALANGLTPIFCIGEVLEEREAGKHFEVVDAQIKGSLFDLSAEDSLRSFWLMNRFGLSVQVKPLHPTRQTTFTLRSVLLWLLNMVRKSPITARSFTVAAVTQATLRNCLLNRT